MSDQLYESSGRFKTLLLGTALVIIVALLFYTEKLVDDLRKEAREILHIWAENYANAASNATSDNLNFIFEYFWRTFLIQMYLSGSFNFRALR